MKYKILFFNTNNVIYRVRIASDYKKSKLIKNKFKIN